MNFYLKGVSDNLDPCVSQTARRKEANEMDNIHDKARLGAKLSRSASQSHKNLNKKSLFIASSTPASAYNDKKSTITMSMDDQSVNLSSLPSMSPYERYICCLAHMNEILLRNNTLNETLSAQEACAILIDHVVRLTATKREILEKGILEASNLKEEERQKFQASLREKVQKLRGKLDHSSIVAYEVGQF